MGVVFLDIFAGTQQNIFGVLVEPMTEALDWSKTQLMLVFTIAAAASGIAALVLGPMIDRYGPRLPLAIASLIGGFLLLASAGINRLWQFYLLYGLIWGLIRPAIGELVAGVTVANWFIKKRGLAFAATSMALPLSAMLLVPIGEVIVRNLGWRALFVTFALMIWLLVCLPATLFMRRRPEDMGLLPDGEDPTLNQETSITPEGLHSSSIREEVNWPAKEAIKTRAYWLVMTSVCLSGGMAGPTVLLYLFPFLTRKGLTPEAAALGVSVMAIGIIAARVVWGLLSARIEVRHAFTLYGLFSTSGVILLMIAPPTPIVVYAAAGYMGLMFGGAYIVQNLIWPDYFGRTSLGTIKGVSMPISAVGRGAAPLIAAVSIDLTGSYNMSFALVAFMFLVSAALIFMAKRPVLKSLPSNTTPTL